MRLRDDNKRRQITAVAARLFADEPFHKVRLDDVAAAAGVGKGTLYVYFDSKEDLYFSIIYDGFADLIDRLKRHLSDTAAPTADRIRVVVAELVRFAFQHPPMFELMRTQGACKEDAAWDDKRDELARLIEQTVRDGVARGELCDAHPELTATYIPSCVRSAMLFGPKGMTEPALVEHIVSTLQNGICRRDQA